MLAPGRRVRVCASDYVCKHTACLNTMLHPHTGTHRLGEAVVEFGKDSPVCDDGARVLFNERVDELEQCDVSIVRVLIIRIIRASSSKHPDAGSWVSASAQCTRASSYSHKNHRA